MNNLSKYGSEIKSVIDSLLLDFSTKSKLFSFSKDGKFSKKHLENYIKNIHFSTSNSILLLNTAAQSTKQLELKKFYENKIKEETGHPDWALDDLKTIKSDFLMNQISHVLPSMKKYIGLIETRIPENDIYCAIYVFYAEYMTVVLAPLWFEILRTHCGINPEKEFTIVAKHVALDIAHADEGIEFLSEYVENSLNSESEMKSIIHSIKEIHSHFTNFTEEMVTYGHRQFNSSSSAEMAQP